MSQIGLTGGLMGRTDGQTSYGGSLAHQRSEQMIKSGGASGWESAAKSGWESVAQQTGEKARRSE